MPFWSGKCLLQFALQWTKISSEQFTGHRVMTPYKGKPATRVCLPDGGFHFVATEYVLRRKKYGIHQCASVIQFEMDDMFGSVRLELAFVEVKYEVSTCPPIWYLQGFAPVGASEELVQVGRKLIS